MTRVKICGITNGDDAQKAVEYGADALGFILVPESPRFVGGDTDRLCELLSAVGPFVNRVGVCTDPVTLTQYTALFDTVQFYEARMEPNRAWYGEYTLIYAARMRDEHSLDNLARSLREELSFVGGDCPIAALLLDTYNPSKLGGSGEAFDWDLALRAKERFGLPIILAGGLTPDNVGEAIRRVRPYAVDVSSGVESSPGKKDHAKMKAFAEAVRAADR